jgi:Tfp pilus assembly protein PilF
MQLAEAVAQAERKSEERRGRTPQGRQYYQLAREALRRGDSEGAARNLQTALTFEPDNADFRDQYRELRRQLGYR